MWRAAFGRMQRIRNINGDRHTAFVRSAAHTLVTSDVSYKVRVDARIRVQRAFGVATLSRR